MKLITLALILITLSTISMGYVMPEDYLGVKIKFYDNTSREQCYDLFESIPSRYYEGLHYISVHQYKRGDNAAGLYFWRNGMGLYNGCQDWTLIHELAHHCQAKRGDSLWLGYLHSGHFDECEVEIRNAYNDLRVERIKEEVRRLQDANDKHN